MVMTGKTQFLTSQRLAVIMKVVRALVPSCHTTSQIGTISNPYKRNKDTCTPFVDGTVKI